MYLVFIQEQVHPIIKSLLEKYSVWWSFKPLSTLEEYLKDYNVALPQYFNPEELYNAIVNIAASNGMIEPGNEKIIVADRRMHECFNAWYIYVPDLFKVCLKHVQPVPHDMSLNLQNDAVYKEIFVEPPENIIYNDSSSLFWLHPDINFAMNKNRAMTYSWNELIMLFENFCLTNRQHFTNLGNSMFQINPMSNLRTLFKFKIFHEKQIEELLKSVTKFLGKTNTVQHCCPKFNPNISDPSLFAVLDFAINHYNKLTPFIYTFSTL